MEVNKNIRLTSTEIAGLWMTYIQDSMAICFLTYFKEHLKDEEIVPVVNESLSISKNHISIIRSIFNTEKIPIPDGFSEKDINLKTKPLFNDLFSLSFVYGMSKIGLSTYGNMASTVARADMVDFFGECITETKELFKKSVNLMLSKGIYDRPPKIPYPKEVSYVTDTSYIGSVFGSRRPLNVAELTELFFHIERNYFASMILTAFLQVVKDEKIKSYFRKGKKLAEKHIQICNEILHEDGMQGNIPVSMEVTDSTESPFSDKLMLYLSNSLNSSAINYLGHALSTSMRKDIGGKYLRLLPDFLLYGEDGVKLLIEKNWFEQPPQAINREHLIKPSKQ